VNDVLNSQTPSDTTKDTAQVGLGDHRLVSRVVHEVEPDAVIDAHLFGLRRLAEDRAEASEFQQQRVDIHRAETFR
jgi:hypothetical protein